MSANNYSFEAKMNMRRKTTVELEFSADDWCLYSGERFDLSRDNVAQNLNEMISFCINNSSSPIEVWKAIEKRITPFSQYGATDSEAVRLIDRIVTTVFES